MCSLTPLPHAAIVALPLRPARSIGGSAMKCHRCQQENPPHAKFCLECAHGGRPDYASSGPHGAARRSRHGSIDTRYSCGRSGICPGDFAWADGGEGAARSDRGNAVVARRSGHRREQDEANPTSPRPPKVTRRESAHAEHRVPGWPARRVTFSLACGRRDGIGPHR